MDLLDFLIHPACLVLRAKIAASADILACLYYRSPRDLNSKV